MNKFNYTIDPAKVKDLRERKNISLQTAKKILFARLLTNRIDDAKSIDDLKFVLHNIIEDLYPSIED